MPSFTWTRGPLGRAEQWRSAADAAVAEVAAAPPLAAVA
jgi:hypothetical protein